MRASITSGTAEPRSTTSGRPIGGPAICAAASKSSRPWTPPPHGSGWTAFSSASSPTPMPGVSPPTAPTPGARASLVPRVPHLIRRREAELLVQRTPVRRGVQHHALDAARPAPPQQLPQERGGNPAAPPRPLGEYVPDQRLPHPRQRGPEIRVARGAHGREHLEGVAEMLGWGFGRGKTHGAAAPLQRTAPLRAAPAVHHAAALERRPRHRPSPGRRASVHAMAAIGEEAGGRHGAANVPPVRRDGQAQDAPGRSIQNLLPLPSADSRPTCPPIRSTPLPTNARPVPVPRENAAQ